MKFSLQPNLSKNEKPMNRQKAKKELNEPDDPTTAIEELRKLAKEATWYSPVFESRLDDQYLVTL